MSRVGIVMHPRREAAIDAARRIIETLEEGGVGTVAVAEDGDVPERDDSIDLVVSVGGDGTFLRAAHAASHVGCPVLGVKVGRVGFLTEVEPDGAVSLVRAALEGRTRVEERLAVTVEPLSGADFPPQWGLNEIMVEKHARHRLVRLAVEVDGTYVTTFSADGVIVATPTGSTAYSFSARGPIVSPGVDSLVLTPIAAHMVFDRSFVLDATSRVQLEVVGEESGVLSADGRRSIGLPVGSRVRIRASSRPARLVRRNDAPGFLSLVREKFGLPGEPGERPGRSDTGDVGAGG
ncbi:MAG TPA: NAD(+)/NADH kinase [Actinomycetota bacterium]|nr:NAD(+)/NADH kinase [Actinomycetota bacterium]